MGQEPDPDSASQDFWEQLRLSWGLGKEEQESSKRRIWIQAVGVTKAVYGRKQDTDLRGLLGHVKEFTPYPRAKGNHCMFLSRSISSKIIILYVHMAIF